MPPLRVLLVEDSPTDAFLVQAHLESGHDEVSVQVCERLSQAMDALARTSFDVVLLDLSLPDGTGLDNYTQLARVSSKTPIIVLTGLSDEATAVDAIARGAADYLIKGATDGPLLERAIRYAVERKKHDIDRLELERARIARAEAEAANRAKDNFLATISHELRTPLNAILGWASLLRTGQLGPAETGQALETIERNAKVQAQLIEDLLDVSRIVTGNLKLHRVKVEMAEVVKEAVEAQKPVARQKGVELQLQLEQNPAVNGDPTRLQQVVWNLVANAIKFTPAKGQVLVKLEQPSAAEAVLTVSDNGQGIEADFVPHIFERFRQADASPTRRHGGLGLGLAIVKNVVELHDGAIEVSSPGPGRGSSFRVTLPIWRDETDRAWDASVVPAAPHSVKGLTILLVEENGQERNTVKSAFETRGAKVMEAPSAEAAVQDLIAGCYPDLIITELDLPGDDGYGLLKQFRALRPDLDHVPVAALTNRNSQGEADRAHAMGFAAFWNKPMAGQVLVGAAAVLCEKS